MPPKLKRPRSPSIPPLGASGDAATAAATTATDPQASPHRAKKLKLLASHSLASPFPDYAHPTPTEAAQVHALLSATHPDLAARRRPPSKGNNSARTCGSVPNVLESLIGTILSQNTSARNSTAAKRGLDAAFGRNDFAAIARARREDVVEAMPGDAEGLPASLPDALIFGEVAESTRAPSVGSKIGEGEEGENEDVEIDREATDELKGGVAFSPGMGWRLLLGKLVYREPLRRGGRGGCAI